MRRRREAREEDRMLFFFFQAEDGIRNIGVTGVQTCALPISTCTASSSSMRATGIASWIVSMTVRTAPARSAKDATAAPMVSDRKSVVQGKSVDLGGRRIIKKKSLHLHTSFSLLVSTPTPPPP